MSYDSRSRRLSKDEAYAEGYCEGCGKRTSPVMVDCGIGPYEYWGYQGVHHDYHPLSPCCQAEVVDVHDVPFEVYRQAFVDDLAKDKILSWFHDMGFSPDEIMAAFRAAHLDSLDEKHAA